MSPVAGDFRLTTDSNDVAARKDLRTLARFDGSASQVKTALDRLPKSLRLRKSCQLRPHGDFLDCGLFTIDSANPAKLQAILARLESLRSQPYISVNSCESALIVAVMSGR